MNWFLSHEIQFVRNKVTTGKKDNLTLDNEDKKTTILLYCGAVSSKIGIFSSEFGVKPVG